MPPSMRTTITIVFGHCQLFRALNLTTYPVPLYVYSKIPCSQCCRGNEINKFVHLAVEAKTFQGPWCMVEGQKWKHDHTLSDSEMSACMHAVYRYYVRVGTTTVRCIDQIPNHDRPNQDQTERYSSNRFTNCCEPVESHPCRLCPRSIVGKTHLLERMCMLHVNSYHHGIPTSIEHLI